MDKKRISNKNVTIDSDKVYNFFTKRSKIVSDTNPYISVLYQDKNADIANYRDKFEKATILPLLKLDKKHNVLDLGCGIGRWAEVISHLVQDYVGVDFSKELIAEAKNRLEGKKNIELKILPAQDISKEFFSCVNTFHRVIISGVLIYLNDADVIKCLQNLSLLLEKGAFDLY